MYGTIYAMKRTTLYLDAELEAMLQAETLRRGRPMAEIVREAVRAYLVESRPTAPPGAGEFASGFEDTAETAEEVLAATNFGR